MMPSGKRSGGSSPGERVQIASAASALLPMPPGPQRVTTLPGCRSSSSLASSCLAAGEVLRAQRLLQRHGAAVRPTAAKDRAAGANLCLALLRLGTERGQVLIILAPGTQAAQQVGTRPSGLTPPAARRPGCLKSLGAASVSRRCWRPIERLRQSVSVKGGEDGLVDTAGEWRWGSAAWSMLSR